MTPSHPNVDPLLAVLSVLTGTDLSHDTLVAGLRQRQLRHFARLLQYRLSTSLDAGSVETCQAILDGLDETTVEQFLRSPAVCEVLRLGQPGHDVRRLVESACVPAAPVAPTLRCGIPVERSLPAVLQHPSSGTICPRVPSDQETDVAVQEVDRALDVLRAVFPEGHAAFVGLVRTVVFRVDTGRPDECWAATSGLAIGRIVVVNPGRNAVPLLAEMLLHEVTHIAIDIAELESPLLRSPSMLGHPARVASPWSGNLLSTHALLHAAVVWAVLLHFWRLADTRGLHREFAGERMAYIRAGFARADLPALLRPVAGELSDRTPRLLAVAQALAA